MNTPDTFSALLDRRAAADGPSPLVTFYDLESGERTELSVTTYANWVAKTASLFVEECDLERGDGLLVDLPAHWLLPVFWGAAWTAGLQVVSDAAAPDAPDAVVCGPDTLSAYADRATDLTVIATALHPLGMRFTTPLPEGVRDFGVEVWSQPDAFFAYDPPSGDDPAWNGLSHAELCAHATATTDVHAQERLLTDTLTPPVFLAALDHGSVVVLRHGSPADAPRIAGQEKADRVQLAAL